VGLYDAESGRFTEIRASREINMPGRYAAVSGFGDAGDCALLGESFLRSPEIASIRSGEYRAIRSFDLGYAKPAEAIATVDCVSWKAPDGLEIQNWLLLNTQRRLNSNFSSLEHTSGSDELLI
jgi:hypothetical protein